MAESSRDGVPNPRHDSRSEVYPGRPESHFLIVQPCFCEKPHARCNDCRLYVAFFRHTSEYMERLRAIAGAFSFYVTSLSFSLLGCVAWYFPVRVTCLYSSFAADQKCRAVAWILESDIRSCDGINRRVQVC